MAFVPATNVAQVNMRYTWGTEPVENTLYFRHNDAWSTVGMGNLAGELFDWWDANMKPHQSPSCTLREIYLRDLTTENGLVFSWTSGLPLAGTGASPSLPNNVSACISFRTGQAGRSRRGRNYTVGMMESHTDGNVIQTSYLTNMLTAYSVFLTWGSLLGFEWVVISRYFNNAPRLTAVVTPINSVLFVNSVPDTQRRRLPQ